MTKAFAALRFEERDFELRDRHARAEGRGPRGARPARADLRDLPERQRAALVMRELSGLGHAEIASVLGGSPQTVKQTIFAARTALHEFAEGREMGCAEVQRVLSDGDGRTLRGRRMRAHVRACRSCREFAAALAERQKELAALAPAAAVGTWLTRLLASVSGSGGAAGTLATKTAAVVAASATIVGATTTVRELTREAPGAAAAAQPARLAPVPASHPRPASAPLDHARFIAAAPRRSRPAHHMISTTEAKRPGAASVSAKPPGAHPVSVKPPDAAPVSAPPSDAASIPAKPPDGASPAPPKPGAAAERPDPLSPSAATRHGPRHRVAATPKPGHDAPGHSGTAPGQGSSPAKAPQVPAGLAVADATAPNGPPADPGASGRAHNQK
jgi:hypothetical protein